MPTSAAIKVARGREAKIEALETAYTDGPGDRDEQAKYDLAVEFINELRKTSAQAYTAAELSKRRFYKLKNNGGAFRPHRQYMRRRSPTACRNSCFVAS